MELYESRRDIPAAGSDTTPFVTRIIHLPCRRNLLIAGFLIVGMAGCRMDQDATSGSGAQIAEGAQTAGLDQMSPVTTGEVASADGVVIRYDVRGTGDPAIVLVHGWTNSRGIWGRHPNTLSRTNRVVALDLAGHGVSDAGREEWTMDAFGEDVAAVVEQLDLPEVVLVGFSMGGPVVLEAAERLPDRVIGVVLVDSMHDPDTPIPDSAMEQLLSQFREAWGDTAFVRAFAFRPDTPDSLVRYVASMMPPQPREHWFPAARAMAEWTRTEMQSALQQLTVPVAAINTTHRPTNIEALRRYAPSFTVDTLDGVGHAGLLLRRVDDFDARLLAIVGRFAAATPAEISG